MPKKRVIRDLPLTGLHPGGRSFGFAGGRKIYADYGIPGETVDVSDLRSTDGYPLGKVGRVVRPSPHRAVPFCRHFGLCGGCTWQHVDYKAQLEMKRDILQSALQKSGIIQPAIPLPEPSPSVTGFRHQMTWSFSARRWYYEDEGRVSDPAGRNALGFHLAGHPFKVVDVEECLLQPGPGTLIAKEIRAFARREGYSYFDPKEHTGLLRNLLVRVTKGGQVMLLMVFAIHDEERIARMMDFIAARFPGIDALMHTVVPDVRQSLTGGEISTYPGRSDHVKEHCNNLIFRISPQSFYQPNPAQAARFFTEIVELTELDGTGRVYDLYSGIGTISLHLAPRAAHVTGIEGSPHAVADARCNARLNRTGNVEFIHGDVLETFTPDFISLHGQPEIVVLDPPRSGTLIEVKKTILQASPRRILYLSCEPVSLARDLRMLSEGYRIVRILPYDQFPHTAHLETLVVLDRDQG